MFDLIKTNKAKQGVEEEQPAFGLVLQRKGSTLGQDEEKDQKYDCSDIFRRFLL